MRKSTLCALGMVLSLGVAAQGATVTLLFDGRSAAPGATAIYHIASWDPATGNPDPSWGGYARRLMFDDGKHGDGAANDGIWGARVALNPAPMHTFEWAVDLDADPGNGWLGVGDKFKVARNEGATVRFFEPPPESSLSRAEIESRYGLDLSTARAPVAVENGEAFAFTVHAPGARAVYLAGSFNNWGDNREGAVTSPRYAMFPVGGGVWLRILPLPHGAIRYKFVARDDAGEYHWAADDHVAARDAEDNTLLDLRALMPGRYFSRVPGRVLAAAEVPTLVEPIASHTLRSDLAQTWVRPGEQHRVVFARTDSDSATTATLHVRYTRDLREWHAADIACADVPTTFTLPIAETEAPYLLTATLGDPSAPLDRATLVLPVVEHPADDLRYGFYANWDRVAEDYAAKAVMNADLLLNAMEYYDYFPAHGDYDPAEAVYEFEPFYGRKIHTADIRGKINADRERGILAIAYIAAYAASKSVFDAHPYPMTDQAGERLIFNGRVLTEKEADEKAERKWFWLMAIARDTPWHAYIVEELRRALIDDERGLLSFDGFEIDSYGHADTARYFSEGSASSGRLLADVIADFIADVWQMAHRTRANAAVSFNCVCEFGIDRMYHITDFLFVENWAGCKPGIEETVDICHKHREAARQRAILKIYPADAGFTDPAYYPPDNLRLMLGMCITGGGSLMIAGEPDERTGQMHALNTLYYPDNVAIPAENARIIGDYNRFDAALYGYNHGRMVRNHALGFYHSQCVARGFENERGDITVTLLNVGAMRTWNAARTDVNPIIREEVAINVPKGRRIASVLYLSPDREALRVPLALEFEQTDGFVRTIVPELHTAGALILVAAD